VNILYKLTHLEDWIYDFYKRLRIISPEDIDIKKICYDLHIFLTYKDCTSIHFSKGRFRNITLNVYDSKEKQKEDFFHELCHLLRHFGKQNMMPKDFLELQEAQANIFTLYATLPHFMLKEYDLNANDIVYTLSDIFGVSDKLVTQRLCQIKNRVLSYTLEG
jgi:Zn-dependent peptidase ImmA (M78 family)